MMEEYALFGSNTEEIKSEVLLFLKPKFKSIWKDIAKKERKNTFNEENLKGITQKINTELKSNGFYTHMCKGIRKGKTHDFITISGTDGEIIIDCKNRRFNQFQSRLQIFTKNDKAFNEYVVKNKN